jgi:hypothetical protein
MLMEQGKILKPATRAGFKICREDRIRTCDPLVPNQVFYRAELPPELKNFKQW